MDKIDIDSFDRIVAYGCSYTAGDELLDHEVLGISFAECNRLKRLSNRSDPNDFYKNLSRYRHIIDTRNIFKPSSIPADNWGSTMLEKIEETNIQASWAGQLAKKLNKPFLNRAKGGSSIDEHVFSIVSDQTANIITDRDLVVVGLTFPERILYINNYDIITLHLGSNNRWPTIDMHKAGIELWNNNNILFNYYKSLFILSKIGLNIKMQSMCTLDFKNINEKLREQFIIPLHSDIVKNMFLPNDTMNLDNEKCGFGHPPIEVHIELADKIYKNCF